MPYYETIFIVRQDMSAAQVETMADGYGELIAEQGGALVKREMWGLRTLAYRISKNRRGHYVMMHLDCPPAALNEMERRMRISEDVLRYMSVKIEEIPEGPSAMLQQRERGERGERSDRPERGERGERRGRDRDDGEGRDRPSRDDNGAAAATDGAN
jgi:small subunit ribosomal protein S6